MNILKMMLTIMVINKQMQEIDIQFRLTDDDLINFNDRKKAIQYYQKNTSKIAKVSFGNFRFIQKTKRHKWMAESEDILNAKSEQYKNSTDGSDSFWVYQHTMPQNETIKQAALKLQQEGDNQGFNKLWYPNLIVSVYSNSQFNKFLKRRL